jgi:pyruvate formate lyase activating enzyme
MKSENNLNSPHGLIAEIQRMSTEDGPGIRTTVFFKGCSLKCIWCHNPECISSKPQIHWIDSRCIGCKTCLDVCPKGALTSSSSGISILRERCDTCGRCAEECPSTAMEVMGKSWRSNELIDELIKDRAYFETSGGGITLSGGDPTLQAPFAGILLKDLKKSGVQTAIDTCGVCSNGALDKLLPNTDLVLYDIKEMDPQKHRRFTGQSNAKVLDNLLYLCDTMATRGYPKKLWIRTPIVPDTTATEDNIQGIGEFLSANVGTLISRWELCAFNNLCRDKYQRLGLDWIFKDSELLSESEMAYLTEVARNTGINPDIVHWSGSTKIEDDGASM